MDSVPECLGCGATVAETATYCRRCHIAIKLYEAKDRLAEEAKELQRKAMDWPVEERGDRPGQWYEETARAEMEMMSAEMREGILDQWRRYDYVRRKKAGFVT